MRILCLFDYNATTGFATVSQNIVGQLKKHFGKKLHLDIIAINFFGDPFAESPEIQVYPAIKMIHSVAGGDEFGRHAFLQNLAKNDYDGCFIIQDLEVIKPIMPKIREWNERKKAQNRKTFKSIYYFPIDGALLPEWLEDLDVFDVLVTYTKYAKSEIMKIRPDLNPVIIQHGINPKHFFPVKEIAPFRANYFGDNAGKYIICTAGRNQFRKDYPTAIMGFAEYKKEFDKSAMLYLHCNPRDYVGWDLFKIFRQLGMKDGIDFMFPPVSMYDHGADLGLLNNIWNSVDIFLSTTTGEGYGLINHEMAACAKPVITPYHTSLKEMSGYGDWFFPLYDFSHYISRQDSMVRYRCCVKEICGRINTVRVNESDTLRNVALAYQWASKQTWEKVCVKWIEIFENTFNA